MKQLSFGIILLLFSPFIFSQSTAIPLMRQIFHDRINQSQVSIDEADRKKDQQFTAGTDEETNQQLTYSLFNQIDNLQNQLEADNSLDVNSKIKYLRGLNEVLASFDNAYRNRRLKAVELPNLIKAYTEAIMEEKQGLSIVPIINNYEVEVGEIISKSFPFQNSPFKEEVYKTLVLKACNRDPDRILTILTANPNISFADSLIKLVAYHNQEDVYTYAQSTNTLGRRIQNVNDPLVKMISKLALSNDGRLYFPFLDNLYKGKMSIEDVQKNLKDDYKYYRLLVNTQIDYSDRLRKRDTPMVMKTLTGMLKKKAIELFINVINGLHDSPDNIRMRVVEPLNPQELYYLCVMGETEIYTSSYLKVYDRIFQRMKNPASDSLLMMVNFNYFKKFIKMSAGYNTLDNFLKRMSKENAEILMKAFVGGLEQTGSLEDAVDVADSYASISDNGLQKLILGEVQNNYNQLVKSNNQRGTTIYGIMNNIFQSIDSASPMNISEKYGIPPVYTVPLALLKDTASGKVIVQQFFYGDKDGNAVFNNFIGAYSNANWKIVSKPEWIEVSSTRGSPVTIYANKPLDSEKDLDAKAQASLGNYLAENNINPTVVIHRGHSYFVKYTIEQLVPSAKVVLLGSCGGYHNLHDVLEISPYAHIIASKQVGSGTINQPMIVSLTELLRQGKDLNWPSIWKDFSTRFKNNDLFDDYVPPHKNLGAIFIMAYNTLEQRSGS